MTPEDRRAEIRASRQRLRARYPRLCLWCGEPLTPEQVEAFRLYCSEEHRRNGADPLISLVKETHGAVDHRDVPL